MTRQARAPVLVVGRGLIGSAVARRLRGDGRAVVTVARGGGHLPTHLPCDLASYRGRMSLREAVHGLRPGCAVLTHGPSDVSWIEWNEAEAEDVHRGVPELLAECGLPAVLVSTDNVFAGDEGGRRPAHRIRPANAYGRVKAKAERAVLAAGHSLVLRVSLVYGWTGGPHRSSYGQRCVEAALRSQEMRAPVDQVFTPIHVADVARVVAAACQAPSLPTGLAHLAGPRELSRFEFATTAYRLAGADERLVRPCLRGETEWACRPRYSSLACDDFAAIPGLAGWRPLPPEEGLRLMLQTAPRREVLL